MPRLNIETTLWSDPRFQKLMIRVGDRHRAIGMVVDLWTIAQKHWWPDRNPIPEEVWAASDLPEDLIECGLAERRSEGIYARGSEERFAWWFERQAAGRKGGLASVESKRSKVNQSSSSAQAELSNPNQTEPSISHSASPSSSKQKDPVGPSDTTALWRFFSEELTKRGINPPPGRLLCHPCSLLVRDYGFDNAKKILTAFLKDTTPSVTQAGFPLAELVAPAFPHTEVGHRIYRQLGVRIN